MLILPQNAAKYLKGLLCVFENATCAALSEISKNSHDSLARVLNGKKFCWQILLQNFILRTFGKLQGGYLIIDDTIISKQFAKSIENIAWLFDSKIGKSILGLNIVLIAWSNGEATIPLALKVYQKKSRKTRIDLAVELLEQVRKLGIKPKYITFDSWYAASQIFKIIQDCQWKFVTQLKSNRKLNGIPLKEIQRNPYWMMLGKITGGAKVIVVRNGKKYFATNDLKLSKKELLSAYKGRWNIETIFRMLHYKLGLDECQARKLNAQNAHFHLCLMAYIALEKERLTQKKTIYQIKRDCSFNFQYADNILFRLNFQGA
ncbi:MAG: transposase [Candidatus Moranbacteria bacterium]|nr:transposase [Candidatus Moranbacteria bacterium]